MIIKRPLPLPAALTLSSTLRHWERFQRVSGSFWSRQRRPPGVGQQAMRLPGGTPRCAFPQVEDVLLRLEGERTRPLTMSYAAFAQLPRTVV